MNEVPLEIDVAGGVATLRLARPERRNALSEPLVEAMGAFFASPPPEVRGRTGFYGSEHLARIELIRELQAEGFNLEAIRRLIEAGNGSSAEVLRFTRASLRL